MFCTAAVHNLYSGQDIGSVVQENKRQNDKQNKNAYLMISSHNTE
jgi:hypothetical protein